jgi:hypothetical protein
MLDSFLAFLKYISSFLCSVSIWSDENSVIVENFFRLIRVLISSEKKIDDSRVRIFNENSTKIDRKHLKELKKKNEYSRI